MLLKHLKLENIRSYNAQTLYFPEGSTLLAGDIGSGKSSLLLAVEFALFGTVRSDLPAEALLKKDSTQGSVELGFFIDGKEVVIKRSLKKDKEGVKQMPGYLIINDLKKELMPLELKAEIITLLGYPDEVLSKGKNYIFRYTVYTPQEEMKFILQENADLRLDVLRKIFNIDKYKIIRENLGLYLKDMRTIIQNIEFKIQPLDDLNKKRELFSTEQDSLKKSLNPIISILTDIKNNLIIKQEEINSLEVMQQNFLQLQQQISSGKAILEEKIKQQTDLREQLESLQIQLQKLILLQDITLETVKTFLEELETKKNDYFIKITNTKSNLSLFQQRIDEIHEFCQLVSGQIATIADKEILKNELIVELQQKNFLLEKKRQLDELLEKTVELITKNKTILQQAMDILENMKTLERCPFCLQNVSQSHKDTINYQELQKLKQAESLLFELNKKKMLILQQREQVTKNNEMLLQKENKLARINIELQQLQEKKNEFISRQEKMMILVKEKNVLTNELEQLQAGERNSFLDEKIKRQIELIEQIQKKTYLEQQVNRGQISLAAAKKEIDHLIAQIQQLELKMLGMESQEQQIITKKRELQELLKQEKEYALQQMELRTKREHLLKQQKELENEITVLLETKNKLMRWREIYNWLEDYFIRLTFAIEKQVMINIYHTFNELFKEWFSILLNEEEIYARLDESFTPIIEMKGYEIPFHHLSGGEKTSAALAYRLALNRVINDVIHNIKTKDLLILDEPTDGFSSEQLDKVREVLERLNLKQMIIVSHESKIESFVENVIQVKKQGQNSCIV